MGTSPVRHALSRIARTLREADIPFAVAGALAVNEHGHLRMTEDVNILLARDGMERVLEVCLGRGWDELSPGSRGFWDTDNMVRVTFVLEGDYPGDRKQKPVAFPNPAEFGTAGGIAFLPLPVLLTLKIASGMTAPHRPGDLADVIELIRKNNLELDYAGELAPYVQEKYLQLWELAQVQDEY